MKKFTLALLTLPLFWLSCKKDNNTTIPDPVPNPVGVVTPVGTPDGSAPAKKTIGANGGTLSSTDGRLKITVPSGALPEDMEISIQSISNHNPLAVNKAFRLQPHGIEFSKPVTIEITWSTDDIKNTIPEALGIAYQDGQGIWQAMGGAVIDKNNKTIRVTTTHFSDWSLFESYFLTSSAQVTPVNGTVALEVFSADDLIVPLVAGQHSPIGQKVPVPASYVKEWKLAGSGKLTPNKDKATYKAPASVPASPNPVAVSVNIDLKQRGKFLLVKHIIITGDDGEIEFRIGGGNWITRQASRAVQRPDGTYAIADSDGDDLGSYVVINWTGGIGTTGFKSPTSNKGTYFHYLIDGGDNFIAHYIDAQGQLVASGGGVTITSMGEDDGFIKGSFVVDPAGHGQMLMSKIQVEGRFRVRKGWQ